MSFALEAARRFRAKADDSRRRAETLRGRAEAALLLTLAAEYERRAAEAEALHRAGTALPLAAPDGGPVEH